MKKITRILALALTLALMLGAVVGVLSSAAEYDAEGYVLATNVAYDDDLAPMFAIDRSKVENVDSLSVTVNGVEATYVGTDDNLYNLSDEEIEAGAVPTAAAIFKSKGIAPKNLDADLTVVVSVDGEAKATITYNVATDYFQAKLDGGATGAKAALYTATLEYAAAAKAHFNKK